MEYSVCLLGLQTVPRCRYAGEGQDQNDLHKLREVVKGQGEENAVIHYTAKLFFE